ncbi:MAG TPA: CpsD/CapB family tyrosine-protein kinase [Pirellulaceae bacterium]|nr:CpsD/CapB family tyrosine-protein kinase [Pirellulaceae bacterium]
MGGDHLRELGHCLLQGLAWPSEATTGVKTVGITSCYRGEGVSTIARLMATTAASSGAHEVLLVDANFDRPSVHETLVHPGSPDPTKTEPNKDNGKFKLQPTQLPNLHALVIGQGQVGAISDSLNSLKTLLADCHGRFDLVVVDCPALNETQSGGRLSNLLDGFVLVVEDACVRREVALRTHRSLERSGGKILGVVLNKRNKCVPNWLYRSL